MVLEPRRSRLTAYRHGKGTLDTLALGHHDRRYFATVGLYRNVYVRRFCSSRASRKGSLRISPSSVRSTAWTMQKAVAERRLADGTLPKTARAQSTQSPSLREARRPVRRAPVALDRLPRVKPRVVMTARMRRSGTGDARHSSPPSSRSSSSPVHNGSDQAMIAARLELAVGG